MAVSTGTISDITDNSAKVTGQIIDLGNGATQFGHIYRKASYGADLRTSLGVPKDLSIFTSELTNLEEGTDYYVKAYISDGKVYKYGKEILLTVGITKIPPTVSTSAISGITQITAVSGGNVISEGSSPVTARGVCWRKSANPTTSDSKTNDGAGIGSFTSNISGLSSGTTYYIRAYATNIAGTSYGNQYSFITQVTDVEGNVYNTVTIGTQTWMIENLKTTKYNDGSLIPSVTETTSWAALGTHAYCWYDNNVSYKSLYGALYNWYTIKSGKLCPSGWHVPTDNEWTTLVNSLGGLSVAGGKLKETGTAHWAYPNIASNESGFTGLPAGLRHSDGLFEWLGSGADWWSSTESTASHAWNFGTENIYERINRDSDLKQAGLSVRCIMD